MKSAQSVFNKVIRHLRKQGVRSHNGGSCLYRGPNGTKCAVGCLIPDELYAPQLEGQSVGYLLDSSHNPEGVKVALGPWILLCDLQKLHDHYMKESGWNDDCEARAEEIADRFGLEMP